MSNGVHSQLEASLSKSPLFRGLSEKDLKRIAADGKEVDYPDAYEIVGEGRGGAGFFVILQGEAKVTVRGQARSVLKAGDSFGEMALLDGQPRSASVVAQGPVKAFGIVAWAFNSFLEKNPKVALQLLRVLASKVRDLEKELIT
jgi:CRP-like cAMP-binding protein